MTTPTPPKGRKPFTPPLAHKVRIDSVYTPAAGTDIRKTFDRLKRQEQRAQQEAAQARPIDTRTLSLFPGGKAAA